MAFKGVVVEVPVLELRINPLGFHRYASEFLRVARAFPHQDGFSPVPYYLFCHSLELAFKAFVLASGNSVGTVKKIGHNLITAREKAKELGLDALVPLSAEEESELTKANHYYHKKGFEYFEPFSALKGYPDLPSLKVLENLADRLVSAIERECSKC